MKRERPRAPGSGGSPAPAGDVSRGLVDGVESLYRAGRTRDVVAAVQAVESNTTGPNVARLQTLAGMALFELGHVTTSFDSLRNGCELASSGSASDRFEAALALFSRRAQFLTPDEALPLLSDLRQLAAATASTNSLGQLHLVVARLEGIRGNCINSRRHARTAAELLSRSSESRQRTDLVHAGLEMVAGNLELAVKSARDGVESAKKTEMFIPLAGSMANLGALMVATGNSQKAKAYLDAAVAMTEQLIQVRFSALDSLAQLSLFNGDQKAFEDHGRLCDELIRVQILPARSWYELAHQITRCAYFEQIEDWAAIVAIADDADAELARRQYKAIRTALLCAKARALARLGRHPDASAALAGAVRACPRGAVDPLIVLEASKALCASLRGDVTHGSVHYDRAIAACRAIGHRYHEWWISAQRDDLQRHSSATAAVPANADVTRTSLLLSDVATILGAGHSIDLLAHRVAAILQSTPMASRTDVANESGRDYQPESSAEWTTTPDGTCTIRLEGSDRLATITVRDVSSIEEISLVKSLADLVHIAVARAAETEREDEDLTLWPRTLRPDGEDTIFRSPRLIELLRIAERLAATNLPVLITGETGTGKEVLARFIHDHSAQKRGPFVPFNCTAVARELVESQLFGHRRGSFTGAIDSYPGIVKAAEGGTLFLDEIGDLEAVVQPKLLRFLESGEIQPVGEVRPQRIAVRVLAATNADLEAMAKQGRFRSDLFYRIGVAHLELPPLRERKDEIPAFAALFLTRFARECGRTGLKLADDLIAALLLYDWPGNIRQLANELRRVAALAADGQTLGAADLAPEVTENWNTRPVAPTRSAVPAVEVRLDQPLTLAMAELERKFIEHALDASSGRVADAAQLLGLSRKGLFLKRRRAGLT